MKNHVQLPTEPLIDYGLFCKRIAQAICPAGEQNLEGIDCIEGKRITCHVVLPAPVCDEEKRSVTPGWQSVLLSDDGRTLDQLCLDQPDAASSQPFLPLGGQLNHQVFELPLPYKLTDDDRRLMEELLPDLPALHYPMSESDVATFMSAYVKLPNRPTWEPNLVTAATIAKRQAEQDTVMRHHQKALQDELAHGRLVAVDANHVPVARLAVGAFIPRDQAIAYLDRYGILHCDKEMSGSRGEETQVPVIHQEQLDGKQNAVGDQKLSDKERRDVVTLYRKLKQKGVKDYCKQVAEQFDITERYVRILARKAEAEQDEGRIDKLLAKKR